MLSSLMVLNCAYVVILINTDCAPTVSLGIGALPNVPTTGQ